MATASPGNRELINEVIAPISSQEVVGLRGDLFAKQNRKAGRKQRRRRRRFLRESV
jgi:hypothetical protein